METGPVRIVPPLRVSGIWKFLPEKKNGNGRHSFTIRRGWTSCGPRGGGGGRLQQPKSNNSFISFWWLFVVWSSSPGSLARGFAFITPMASMKIDSPAGPVTWPTWRPHDTPHCFISAKRCVRTREENLFISSLCVRIRRWSKLFILRLICIFSSMADWLWRFIAAKATHWCTDRSVILIFFFKWNFGEARRPIGHDLFLFRVSGSVSMHERGFGHHQVVVAALLLLVFLVSISAPPYCGLSREMFAIFSSISMFLIYSRNALCKLNISHLIYSFDSNNLAGHYVTTHSTGHVTCFTCCRQVNGHVGCLFEPAKVGTLACTWITWLAPVHRCSFVEISLQNGNGWGFDRNSWSIFNQWTSEWVDKWRQMMRYGVPHATTQWSNWFLDR